MASAQQLYDEWVALETQAWAAQAAVSTAVVDQGAGGGGPTSAMLQELTRLRDASQAALERMTYARTPRP